MKNKTKRLQLNKYTLTNLTKLELNQNLKVIKGGATDWCGSNNCSNDGQTTCPNNTTALPETVC